MKNKPSYYLEKFGVKTKATKSFIDDKLDLFSIDEFHEIILIDEILSFFVRAYYGSLFCLLTSLTLYHTHIFRNKLLVEFASILMILVMIACLVFFIKGVIVRKKLIIIINKIFHKFVRGEI